jgi:hypothetical protein
MRDHYSGDWYESKIDFGNKTDVPFAPRSSLRPIHNQPNGISIMTTRRAPTSKANVDRAATHIDETVWVGVSRASAR